MTKRKFKFIFISCLLLGAISIVILQTDNPLSNDGTSRVIQSSGAIYGLHFSSNNELTAATNSQVQSYDVNAGELLKGRNLRVRRLSSDGKYGIGDGGELWNINTGKPVSSLQDYANNSVLLPVFSPDNSFVGSVWKKRKRGTKDVIGINTWNSKTGQSIWFQSFAYNDLTDFYKHPLAFSRDGKWLIEADAYSGATPKSKINVRDANTGKIIRTLYKSPAADRFEPGWHLITISPDGSLVAAVGGAATASHVDGHNGAIYIWELATGKLLGKCWKSRFISRWITPQVIAFSPDSQKLASGNAVYGRRGAGGDGEVTLWDVKTQKLLQTYGSDTPVDKLTFRLSQLQRMLQGNIDRPSQAPLAGDKSASVSALAFSPDGKLLAVGETEGAIKIWPVP